MSKVSAQADLRDVLTAFTTACFALDVLPEGGFRLAAISESGAEAIGLAETQIVGRMPEELWPEPDAARLVAKLRMAVESGLPVEVEGLGGREGLSAVLIPVRDAVGRVGRIIATCRDIAAKPQGGNEARWGLRIVEAAGRDAVADEERYLAMLDFTPYPMLLHSQQCIEYVNDAACRLFRGERGDLIGRHYLDFVADADRDVVGKAMQEVLRGGRILEFARRMLVRFDGSVFPAEVSAAARQHSGEPIAQVVIREMTEQERAARALRESEQRFRALFQQAQDVILVIDVEGRVIDANNTASDRLGYGFTELFDLPISRIVITDFAYTRRTVQQLINRALKGEAVVAETMLRRRDHSTYPVETLIRSITIDEELLLLVVSRDITARKRAEEALARKTEVLKLTLETMDQGITMFDENLRLIAANRRYFEMFDFPEQMSEIGTPLEAFIRCNAVRGEYGPGDVEKLVAERVALAEQFHPHVLERVRPNGTVVEIRGAPTPQGGFVTTYTDITEHKRAQEALARKSAVLEATLESMAQGICMFDAELRLIAANRRFFDMMNLPPVFAAHGTPFESIVRYNAMRGEYGPGDIDHLVEKRIALAREFRPYILERKRPDGMVVEIRGMPTAEGGFVTTYTDITERKRAEQALRESEEKLRIISQSVLDPLVLIGPTGRVSFWNRAAERMFGYRLEEIADHDIHELLAPPQYRAQALEGMQRFAVTGTGPVVGTLREMEAVRRDGTVFPVEIAIAPLRIGEEWSAVGLIRDISERKRVERELQRLATSDPLTGVFNRRHFMELASRELQRAHRHDLPLAVAMIDIDHFKRINDTHGHAAGDEALRALASHCAEALRTSDIFGRLGGEEFAILLPETDEIGAALLAERLRRDIAGMTFGSADSSFGFTISIGISTWRNPEPAIDAALNRADAALYRAKQDGRNRVVVEGDREPWGAIFP